MAENPEVKELKSRADLAKLKATGERQEFPFKVSALKVVVSPLGAVGYAMRFRRPDGKQGILSLGQADLTNRKPMEAPVIGQPLTVEEAVTLANAINVQRKNGVDVIAQRHVAKHFSGRQKTFSTHVLEFIEADRQHHRRWRETAAGLGYRFPWHGDGEPALIEDSLCDRWRDRSLTEITDDELTLVIQEARDRAIPGWGVKGKGPRPSRGRRLAAALGSLFKWLKREGRIKTNVLRDVSRPEQLKARDRALNAKINIRNADELRWFWQATTNMGYPYGCLCQVLLLTGCRRSEISQLRWSELSDDLSTLHLPGARTKNARPHDVPLSKQARDILKSVPRVNDTYVFADGPGKSMGNFSCRKSQLDLLMLTEATKDRNEAVTIPPWQLHDLRRTASTGMNGIKILPHIVEALLNHISTGAQAGVAGTYNRYTYEDEKRDAVDRWGIYIERIVSGRDARNVVPMRR